LALLIQEGMVVERCRPDGSTGYFLTAAGRRLLDE
jgi:hypothetical protein